ncbi:LOW QUALITY PROTEIN: HS12A-like protein, partial [Mya arenaria]
RNFKAFGKQALENYADLEADGHKSHYFFHHFKMKLYEGKKLSRETTLLDQTGKEMKAMDVYIVVLQYFHTKVMEHVGQVKSDQGIQNKPSKLILWMLSIPAIWTDSARQFMREAATNGGMENVRLVLEPEAGALFAIDKPLKLREDWSTEKFPVGHKYILADLGGGTIDICVHEILDEDSVNRATGEYAGGSKVNFEIEQFFVSLFGAPALDEFRTKFTHSYQDFIKSVEAKKSTFSNSSNRITLPLDYDFVTLVENDNGETIQEMIKDSMYKDRVQYRITGRLGGYSESPYVRERIQQVFPQLTTVMVEDGRLAVMKGAVMMGLKPRNIIQRRARFTYGLGRIELFVEGEHPEVFKYILDVETWCLRVFHKLIERGQLLQHQQEFSNPSYSTFKNPERKPLVWPISLWWSPRPNPRYCCLEDECERVGRITIQPPPHGWPDVVHSVEKLLVGETEFTMKGFVKETDEEYEVNMDLL